VKLAAIIAVLGNPLAAQTFNAPTGCEVYLTVQGRDCTVDNHFTCAADPAGEQHRASFDENAMTYLGAIDEETQWINSTHIIGGHSEELGSNPLDRASFSELIATGSDSYDFKTNSAEVGQTRYVGVDRLTGNSRKVDGVTLEETAYDITAYAGDGSVLWSSKGREFISREFRIFLSGKSTVTTPTGTFDTDGTPVQFIRPGEAGFASVKPKFGCGAMMSSYEVIQ
jgi:hypothetical protein